MPAEIKCGAYNGIFQGTANLLCMTLALIATPIEGRITPNQGIDQVVEIKYCSGTLPRIEIHKYLQQSNSRILLGQSKVHTYYIKELEEQKQE